MAIRVIVNGAQGKMGKLACETIKNHPDFELVGGLTRQDNLRQSIMNLQADIVVDLTRADCVYENSLAIIESGAHPVIGTSGLDTDQIETLKTYCQREKLGGIIAPNFSISAVLMMRFAAEAARLLPEVEIVEMHHQQKFDAPSGTAVKTAEMIAKARTTNPQGIKGHELIMGARGGSHQGVTIHSLRLPGVVARQQVIFGTTGETLTITHDSIDRISFMPGVVLACQKVKNLDSLYYGLEHLL
ncbi:4-hydroxy-tetrahydrodipicolinate reductase [Legionella hackeliae]|uniref:4-hydroxy-tetrahydrodipicolinate reductase n=1 Tax=Legionella hackeliae TaxID=449 RepID=A0A0A8UQK7_LEGHA|nr:4-hydroxy-tetrahydrodipicolinate reductase [Legionella hackeliae]KTD13540.1 Dihydrodipicolinate reductase [Legionella hackeliae]CEK09387.1 Dihydrodipicolinate reductase [Legionella hackeliae]STX49294.1 dihydrodipicolinate reductases [Legionella hackeliae]